MAGQKLKTHKGVKKRFRKTGTGKLMHYPANKRHILTSKRRNRNFRRLWIARITAACRSHGLLYSRFIHALKQAGIGLDRKVLSNMAIADPGGFTKLVDTAKAQMDTAKAQMAKA